MAADARTAMMASSRAHGEGGQGDALDDGVRVELHERAVDLGTGVRLEAVGHDVALLHGLAGAVPPLAAGAEAGPAAAPQSGLADERDDAPRARGS